MELFAFTEGGELARQDSLDMTGITCDEISSLRCDLDLDNVAVLRSKYEHVVEVLVKCVTGLSASATGEPYCCYKE